MSKRLLQYDAEVAEALPSGGEVSNPWLGPLPYAFEPVGKAFLEAQLKLHGLMPYHSDDDSDSSSSDEEEEGKTGTGESYVSDVLIKRDCGS